MQGFYWTVVLLAILVGHAGLHVAMYNRLNSFGFKRKPVKVISKVLFFTMIFVPIVFAAVYFGQLKSMLTGNPDWKLPSPIRAYGWVCLIAWLVLGIPWIVWRPLLGLEWIRIPRRIRVTDVQAEASNPLSLSPRSRVLSRFPGNQIYTLAAEELTLPVAGLPRKLDGYRIAHLSDIHLTGHVHGDYTKYVVQVANQWQPDMMVLTGDIIDKLECVDWLHEIFSPAKANDGCYFVLGNHDKRIPDPGLTRDAMTAAGWTDLGGKVIRTELAGTSVSLLGNEHPWFSRPSEVPQDADFRILLSHSPDQLPWARKHNVNLMFAGHTHGGQGRLPIIGPILSPSIHGSRYASGDFYKSPTTMHVSRGLSGTHLMRINCRPELSLLTLKSPTA